MGFRIRTAVALAIVGSLAAACGGGVTPTSAPTPDTSWIPDGFEQLSRYPTVAFKKIEDPTCDFGRCMGYQFVVRAGCPNSLHVELTTVDVNGTIIVSANDTVGRLPAGAKAELIFNIPGGWGLRLVNTQLSRISCN